MYIGDYLARRELYTPGKLAFVDTGKIPEWRLTYQDMNTRANRLANWFIDVAHINKGDRVAILARDGIEHLDTFFACSKIGAVHTALNWRLHWREILAILRNTTPKVLIYSDDFRENVAQIQSSFEQDATIVQHYIHIEGPGVSGSEHFESIFQNSSSLTVTCEELTAEDIAALIFTGGTSGDPKAAKISHRMIAWNTLNTVIHDVHHDDIYLNVFPLFHTGGLFVYTLPQVIIGGTTILVRQFEPQLVLDLLEREKVTIFAAVPTMYQMLTQAPNWKKCDLASLRFCTSGGAPLPVPLVEKYSLEKQVKFKQGFGMTEFGPGIFALASEDAVRKAGSIGRPNFFVDARIVDEGGNQLGPEEVGELALKGPSYCSGYFNNLQASEDVIDNQGYFHTGDLAKYDQEGYFYIVDRIKDMFISGGENIYPAEIEAVLYQHPAVHQCAVVGIPDEKWGEIGIAFVVVNPGTHTTADELNAHMGNNLASFKVPKEVRVIDEMPISGAGKILKRELRAQFKHSHS
jgi:fatty-acyl-CoA synthase